MKNKNLAKMEQDVKARGTATFANVLKDSRDQLVKKVMVLILLNRQKYSELQCNVSFKVYKASHMSKN